MPHCKVDLAEAIGKSINEQLKKLVFSETVKKNIVLKPNVCCVCDRLVEYDKLTFVKEKILKKSSKTTLSSVRDDVPVALLNMYKYKNLGTKRWMKKALMSPRSCYNPNKKEFLCCRSCKTAVTSSAIGSHSISNYLVGDAPVCLLDLTDIELAFVAPHCGRVSPNVAFGGPHRGSTLGVSRKIPMWSTPGFPHWGSPYVAHIEDTPISTPQCGPHWNATI
jgi:hypothetical protein